MSNTACEKYVEVNEDLYAFSPTTPIRSVQNNNKSQLNQRIMADNFYGNPSNYFKIQSSIAENISGRDVKDADFFRYIQMQGKRVFTEEKKDKLLIEIDETKVVLIRLNTLYQSFKNGELKEEELKTKFLETIINYFKYTHLQTNSYVYSKDTGICMIRRIKEESYSKLGSVLRRKNAKLWGKNPAEVLRVFQTFLNSHYVERKSIVEKVKKDFIAGSKVENETEKTLVVYDLLEVDETGKEIKPVPCYKDEVQSESSAGTTEGPITRNKAKTLDRMNKVQTRSATKNQRGGATNKIVRPPKNFPANVQLKPSSHSIEQFHMWWRQQFSRPLFRLIGVEIGESSKDMFNSVFNSLTKFFEDRTFTQSILDNITDVYAYVFDEMRDILEEIDCRMQHGQEACVVRRNEGVMINASLNSLRGTIQKIIIEKNKSSVNVSPAFIDACLASYCTNRECFPSGKLDGDASSDIFDIIKQELAGKWNMGELVMGVFCVMNLSESANNPPPVPYIDINNLWLEVNRVNATELFSKKSRFYGECKKLIQKLPFYENKIKDFLSSDIYIRFIETVDRIKNGEVLNAFEERVRVTAFLEALDKINAASAIGTLQFVDILAKFNTTKLICSYDHIKDKNRFKEFLNSYRFENSVSKLPLSENLD
jgi:hypothetical protein